MIDQRKQQTTANAELTIVDQHRHATNMAVGKQATGAGADRVSQGMRLAFGKNVGTAARVQKNDVIVSIHTSAEFYLDARNALRKAGMKFPSSVTISVTRGAEHLRVKGLI